MQKVFQYEPWQHLTKEETRESKGSMKYLFTPYYKVLILRLCDFHQTGDSIP